MTKKEILETFAHNALGLIQQAEAQEDKDLLVLAHSNLLALTAIEKGHTDYLMMAFMAFCESIKQVEEDKRDQLVKDLLKAAGLSPN